MGLKRAVDAGYTEEWPRTALPLLQDSYKGAGGILRLTMIKCLLFSISTRISLEPVRTPGTVDSTLSLFLKKFLELDSLTGPEQGPMCLHQF